MQAMRGVKSIVAVMIMGLAGGCAMLQGAGGAQTDDAFDRVERGALVIDGVPQIPDAVHDGLIPYQNIRAHSFQDWFLDGVLITTRFGETAQAHHLVSPGGARRQLTFYDEPVRGVDASPKGGAFLFIKDTGGDEFYQGHIFDIHADAPLAFTRPGTRNGGFTWTDDGALVAWYEAHDGDPNYTIKIGDPKAPETIRTALLGEGALFPADWSSDKSTLLLQQYVSVLKSRLFTLDVETGALAELNPEDDVAYSGGQLLDGGDVLTVTDKDSEFRNLVRLSPDGAMRSYTRSVNWDVNEFALSPKGDLVAFIINEDGNGLIYLLELSSGVISKGPDLPPGVASGLAFSPDGEQIGFTFNAATSPSDAYSFEIDTRVLTRWTRAEVGGLNAESFVAPRLVRYANHDGMEIPAFVYTPQTEGRHPVIISIHGGPEGQARPTFSSTYQYWVKELGAAVVVPNVRGSSGYGKSYVAMDNGLNRKKSVDDIGALLDWIAVQPDLDPERVVVYGGSYGGYMVLASLIDHGDRLAGGVDIVGISDFATFLTNTKGYRRDLRRAEYGDERDPEIAAFFDKISPLKNADEIDKPLFIIQGANDPRVPASEAEQILSAVRANGGDAWYLLAKDEGHGFRKKSNRDFMSEAVVVFLKQLLVAPDMTNEPVAGLSALEREG